MHWGMALRNAFTVLFAAIAVHFACTLGLVPAPHAVTEALYEGIQIGAFALVAARALAVRRNRCAWTLIAGGLGQWVLGDLASELGHETVASAFRLAMFGLVYVALAMLLRDRIRPLPGWLTIDGLLAGLTLAALASTVFAPVQTATQGDPATVVLSLALLVCDLLLLIVVLVGFTATAFRPGRAWWLLGAALAGCAVADAIHATGAYASDSLWCAAITAVALAAWQRSARPTRAHVGWALSIIPLGGSAISITTLLYGALAHARPLTLGLAAAALFAGIARAVLMLAENFRLLHKARREALTDKLTDLPNRRALVHDLDAAADGRKPHTLVFFDLDGFKDYNDAFGHPAGDALLRRLAPALARVGRAYRLGGDEFCLLLAGSLSDDHVVVGHAVAALSEHGDGFSIGASHGLVVLPDDAHDATEALRLADERMYARKRRRRGGSRGQARDLLVTVIAERQPDLDDHSSSVADLAVAVGRRLGLNAEDLDVLLRAAELHDVGKVAVPDSILNKPGPLDAVEWEIMRQHTIVGERILAAADSMRPVAALVHSSHERWDGRGYPDALAGEAIPLGARIVCACDAYDAMRSERPYKAAMSRDEALSELRRCA